MLSTFLSICCLVVAVVVSVGRRRTHRRRRCCCRRRCYLCTTKPCTRNGCTIYHSLVGDKMCRHSPSSLHRLPRPYFYFIFIFIFYINLYIFASFCFYFFCYFHFAISFVFNQLISFFSIPSYFRQSLFTFYLLIVVENFPARESLGAKEGDILIDDRFYVQGYKVI